MTEILIAAGAFFVAIGVLVAIHEYGHFAVARLLGIKVLSFSIGFGKPLWERRYGADGTRYMLSAIPLGGYVKMLDERDGPVAPQDRGRAFNRQPVWSRIAVLLAGPMANFLFAIAAYWLLFVAGVPGVRPIVGTVTADSYAAVAGIEPRDEIVAVDGKATGTWEAVTLALLDGLLDDSRVALTLQKESGEQRNALVDIGDDLHRLTEPGALFDGLGISTWTPVLPARLGEVLPDGPAAAAGLRAGDLVLRADGVPFVDWGEWVAFVRANPGKLVRVSILRGEREQQLDLRIGTIEEGEETIGRIGAAVLVPPDLYDSLRAEQRYSLTAALPIALAKTWDMSALTLRMVWRMLSGDVSARNISGPINIADYAGKTASIGGVAFLSFLAIVSISLGLINLFPIPMLDGGQIVYQLAELLKGSPVSERTEIIGQQIGIAMILVLMTFAFYNDILRLVG